VEAFELRSRLAECGDVDRFEIVEAVHRVDAVDPTGSLTGPTSNRFHSARLLGRCPALAPGLMRDAEERGGV
jgi:hypothetical protein